MSTTATTPAAPAPSVSRLRGGPRRRSLPHLVLGVLLVCACTAGAVVWSLAVGERRAALALTRPITLGHTLEAADLREVEVALDGDVDAIPADEASAVVGRIAATSLPAGVLLPRAALGTAPVPVAGHAVAALAVPSGQAPPDLDAGASVLVVLAADPAAGTGETAAGSSWPGVVVTVAHQSDDRGVVMSVELAEDDARQVAAAPAGRLSVVLVAGGGR